MVSDELLAATVPGAEAAFGRELRGAVADVVDETFLAKVGIGHRPRAGHGLARWRTSAACSTP